MPKTIRASGSQGYYRNDPHQTYYSNISTSQTGMQPQAMPSLPSYPPSNPPPPQPQYHSVPQSAPVPLRASSGAWTPTDDQTLMQARASGLNWAPIQSQYFPNKTPNACRKRHERLMDRRNTDDWEQTKLENLAKEYMSMRREIWAPLASRTGEKWTIVESKCMSSGLKNLQSAARACTRRERLESGSGGMAHALVRHDPEHGGYEDPHTDDSGIGLDELEAEYSADTGSYGPGSSLSPNSNGGGGRGGYGGANATRAYEQMLRHGQERERGVDQYGAVQMGQMRPEYGMQQRLPSIDMGIGAIINRPSGGV